MPKRNQPMTIMASCRYGGPFAASSKETSNIRLNEASFTVGTSLPAWSRWRRAADVIAVPAPHFRLSVPVAVADPVDFRIESGHRSSRSRLSDRRVGRAEEPPEFAAEQQLSRRSSRDIRHCASASPLDSRSRRRRRFRTRRSAVFAGFARVSRRDDEPAQVTGRDGSCLLPVSQHACRYACARLAEAAKRCHRESNIKMAAWRKSLQNGCRCTAARTSA